jgi:hypothetical protein
VTLIIAVGARFDVKTLARITPLNIRINAIFQHLTEYGRHRNGRTGGRRHGHPAHTHGPIPVSDKLSHFRTLIGIHNAPTFTAISVIKRPALNVGIYARTEMS